MTYRQIYDRAESKLERSEITLGEFEEMTKFLDEEERPYGEWKLDGWVKDQFGSTYKQFSCSQCGIKMKNVYPYCVCGAIMKKA